MPCSCARLHMVPAATEPPRWVCSSASPTSARTICASVWGTTRPCDSLLLARLGPVVGACRLRAEGAQRVDPGGVARVRDVALEPQHVGSCGGEGLGRLRSEAERDHRVEGA